LLLQRLGELLIVILQLFERCFLPLHTLRELLA
jgi:hypothetical protein